MKHEDSSGLIKFLEQQKVRYEAATREMAEIEKTLEDLQKTDQPQPGEVLLQLRNEVATLRSKLMESEQKKADTSSDVQLLCQMINTRETALSDTFTQLQNMSEEMATLYHHVCTVNGQTPNRIMLDHSKSSATTDNNETNEADNLPANNANEISKVSTISQLELLRSKLRTDVNINLDNECSAGDAPVVVDTLQDQIRHLRRAIQHTLDVNKSQVHHAPGSPSDSGLSESEVQELQEQVIKLKSLLSTKREQIATLRTVLKANKQTAEIALTNLKSKYDTEKSIVSETMMKLRNELRLLKEDAATFSS